MHAQSFQSCLTLRNPMECSPPGCSVHGILQARIWSGLPRPPSGDLPNPGALISPALAGRFFTTSTACWSWNFSTVATWWQELTHLKRPWCWERLRAGGEGNDRGWDDWMASLTRWTWVWINSGSWQWIGRPGVLQSKGSQRVGHDWATELNWALPTFPYLGSKTNRTITQLSYEHRRQRFWKDVITFQGACNVCVHLTLFDVLKARYLFYLIIFIFQLLIWWTHLQNRNTVTDIENKLMVTKGEGG